MFNDTLPSLLSGQRQSRDLQTFGGQRWLWCCRYIGPLLPNGKPQLELLFVILSYKFLCSIRIHSTPHIGILSPQFIEDPHIDLLYFVFNHCAFQVIKVVISGDACFYSPFASPSIWGFVWSRCSSYIWVTQLCSSSRAGKRYADGYARYTHYIRLIFYQSRVILHVSWRCRSNSLSILNKGITLVSSYFKWFSIL